MAQGLADLAESGGGGVDFGFWICFGFFGSPYFTTTARTNCAVHCTAASALGTLISFVVYTYAAPGLNGAPYNSQPAGPFAVRTMDPMPPLLYYTILCARQTFCSAKLKFTGERVVEISRGNFLYHRRHSS